MRCCLLPALVYKALYSTESFKDSICQKITSVTIAVQVLFPNPLLDVVPMKNKNKTFSAITDLHSLCLLLKKCINWQELEAVSCTCSCREDTKMSIAV